MDILFWAYDNDKMFKSFETNVITIKTDKYDNLNSWKKGNEIYNLNGIKIDYISYYDNKIRYAITNTSGKNLDLTFRGISINNYTVSEIDYDLFDEQVLNDNQIFFDIKINDDFKNNNNIDKVNRVDFYLSYTENDSYEEFKTDNITTLIE